MVPAAAAVAITCWLCCSALPATVEHQTGRLLLLLSLPPLLLPGASSSIASRCDCCLLLLRPLRPPPPPPLQLLPRCSYMHTQTRVHAERAPRTAGVVGEQAGRVGAVRQAQASVSAALDGGRNAKAASCQEGGGGGHHDLRTCTPRQQQQRSTA